MFGLGDLVRLIDRGDLLPLESLQHNRRLGLRIPLPSFHVITPVRTKHRVHVQPASVLMGSSMVLTNTLITKYVTKDASSTKRR